MVGIPRRGVRRFRSQLGSKLGAAAVKMPSFRPTAGAAPRRGRCKKLPAPAGSNVPPGVSMRTHFCGLIDEALVGQTVTLCGWADVARNLGGLCFIDLRDHEGIVQIVAEPDSNIPGNADVLSAAAHVGYEDCLRVTGVVRKRQSINDKIRTGQVKIVATKRS